MAKIPKKVAERLARTLGTFQKILRDAKDRDVNESDTVTIVTDMLAEVFGYDKYTDITSEQAVRGTYCDVAVKYEGGVKFIIEVKAIGLTLKENHLRQAVNYGAHQGIPWVVLTNGVRWEIYRLTFEQPITYDQVCAFDYLELSSRKKEDQDYLYLLCKEGLSRAAIESFHEHVQVVNRFTLAALIRSDPVLAVLRRELRRLGPDVRISVEEINEILPDVLKRDVIEGEAAAQAGRRVQRASAQPLRSRRKKKARSEGPQTDGP